MTPLENFNFIVDIEKKNRCRRWGLALDGNRTHFSYIDYISQPRQIRGTKFHVLPCPHEHTGLYDDYFFFLVDKTWQISAPRCVVKSGTRWDKILRLLEKLTGVDLRFVPKWNTKRLSKRISEAAEIEVVKQIYLDARYSVKQVPSDPSPPRGDDLLVTDTEWKSTLELTVECSIGKLKESENRRAQQERKEMLLWILTAKRSLKEAKTFLRTAEEKTLVAFQSLQEELKHRQILPIS